LPALFRRALEYMGIAGKCGLYCRLLKAMRLSPALNAIIDTMSEGSD